MMKYLLILVAMLLACWAGYAVGRADLDDWLVIERARVKNLAHQLRTCEEY